MSERSLKGVQAMKSTRVRLLPVALAAAALLPIAAHAQSVEEVIATIRERAEAHGVAAAPLVALSYCESRHVVTARGDDGRSHGAFQLFEGGLLPHFRSLGYSSPYNITDAADYVARVYSGEFRAAGVHMGHWSCWGR